MADVSITKGSPLSPLEGNYSHISFNYIKCLPQILNEKNRILFAVQHFELCLQLCPQH